MILFYVGRTYSSLCIPLQSPGSSWHGRAIGAQGGGFGAQGGFEGSCVYGLWEQSFGGKGV